MIRFDAEILPPFELSQEKIEFGSLTRNRHGHGGSLSRVHLPEGEGRGLGVELGEGGAPRVALEEGGAEVLRGESDGQDLPALSFGHGFKIVISS